ncbi:MAG: CAP domain-containing protein [Acidobacteriota bacterium]
MGAKFFFILVLAGLLGPGGFQGGVFAEGMPREPQTSSSKKAWKLFELAQGENPRLKWNTCLARKAAFRAEIMVSEGYFAHEDPDTGKNPAWGLVASCLECSYAGENLSRGDYPPEEIHSAFMKSPTHRANILDGRFRFMGVGCFESVCVELFGGSGVPAPPRLRRSMPYH